DLHLSSHSFPTRRSSDLGMAGRPPFSQMFFGALALIHAPLVVPLPSGGGGLEVAFMQGFAGDFGAAQVRMLLWWRFYSAVLLTALGVCVLVRQLGYRAAVELFKIGWGRTRPADAQLRRRAGEADAP